MTTVLGINIRFERRRYGRTTFTWAYAQVSTDTILLGDPWPCVTPARRELEQAVRVFVLGEKPEAVYNAPATTGEQS